MTCVLDSRDLRYRYPDGREALRGVDLDVTHGERVAVLGPNGAGKTTFAYHLNGLLQGTGRLEVAGTVVEDSTIRDLRSRVGLVFQDPDDQLFMPTVLEDVAFGPLNQGLTREQALARVKDALAAVRMEHAADRAPHQLSMGERRRVAIATVLAMEPELLVLDEPTANLDPRARRELLQVLDRIDRTMLVVTHDLPFAAQLCERAVILAGGRIVGDGRCQAILGDEVLLARHDLELPEGFDAERLGRPLGRRSQAAAARVSRGSDQAVSAAYCGRPAGR
jgi:cobalt transport protein ATP-binding subunit